MVMVMGGCDDCDDNDDYGGDGNNSHYTGNGSDLNDHGDTG